MQDNSKFDELLISYLSKELNEEDEAFVLQWINFDEHNRQYYETFKRLWQLLEVKANSEQINVKDEWSHFQEAMVIRQQQTSFAEKQEPAAYKITGNHLPPQKGAMLKIFASIAVAASLILLISLIPESLEHRKADNRVGQDIGGKTEVLSPLVRYERNHSGHSKRLVLNDGTEITLADKSEIHYQEPFAANRRMVTLKGKAFFKVAKDKTKPFTVFSGDLSTTVLGTSFTVSAYENERNIIVTLYEGKVLVKTDLGFKKKLARDYYLLPGQELIYNHFSSITRVRSFLLHPQTTARKEKSNKATGQADMPDIPLYEKGSWFMFNNQSLEHVFEQLENIYDIKILYSKKDVDKKYFIGKFERSVAVENVLKQIALVNNLKLHKQDDNFIISK